MTALTKDQVRHIALLARLRLTEDEIGRYTTELTGVLKYIEKLQELPTDDVPPTAQVSGVANVFRKDAVCPQTVSPESLLHNSPLPLRDRHIQTLAAHSHPKSATEDAAF